MKSSNKAVQLLLYILSALATSALYGLFAFFVIYRGLAGGELLRAYIWNIVCIIALLLLDKITEEMEVPKGPALTRKANSMRRMLYAASFISFKTTLYFFYIFVLIVSRVSILEPGLFIPEFQRFVLAIEYCLILLVAFDKFIEYLLKDDKRIQRIFKKMKREEAAA
ncbi:MAG: hypothetical protein FWE12_01350 [Oscillospiraceae bacterium]|nr:hypothetical protein [Oscillospiraceae bacterium]